MPSSVKSTRSRDDAEKLAGAPDKLQHVGDGASSYDESLESRAAAEGIDAVFLAKVQVINRGLADCGFGRYQWQLFFSAGFGWFADNIWLQAIAIVMPAIAAEEGFRPYPGIRMATFALYTGLIPGAFFWGMTADVWGRRIAWNSTLFIGAVFGLAVGASPNFYVLCVLLALCGFGTGGNLPVDGALFLEFIPNSHNYLLTFLSVWWAIGQVVASLICWVFLAKYSCDAARVGIDGYRCTTENNQGWRYSMYTLGALMLFLWAIRFFVFPMHESPKFLVAKGRDEDAVAVIQAIAKMNGREVHLSTQDLHRAAVPYFRKEGDGAQVAAGFTTFELIKMSFKEWDSQQFKMLFATRRLAWSSSLLIFIYGALGLAYPMYNAFLSGFLAAKGAESGDTSIDYVYGGYTYQAACGVIGSIAAAALVQWGPGGRKFAMAFFTVGAGAFLFGLTAARSQASINALTCMAALFQNAFYGVLYAYAPEAFPTPARGTGDALVSTASRVTGLFAPIIAVYSPAADSPNGPVYTAAAIFVATGLSMMLLPIETRGRDATRARARTRSIPFIRRFLPALGRSRRGSS
ncbi:uncharacterized protein RHOBADRAFT_46262 [Rhodotorula graminis WP1]|uniref:Major facilitator superfamily (MFS) profile domain-containing protein n=1 Tax=Rhodotorula graminis (strain WP1) TaxID=578459 RepID=A0A0N8PZS7_RHOGW|nr:uncharacterized protein RHOBADRAFT_46262 [Rhodotorula graminis WP1]KPV73157.1 hypothetical protein RHOBADRAFT_46262 [Rhodotorula graminis WP1]